jgi:hypothetical protein
VRNQQHIWAAVALDVDQRRVSLEMQK